MVKIIKLSDIRKGTMLYAIASQVLKLTGVYTFHTGTTFYRVVAEVPNE
jgi:hypothetical protein